MCIRDRYHGDSDHAIFGDGSDLSLYHDGNNSVIKNITGDLYINANSSQTGILVAGSTGAVTLRHGGNLKFETEATGVKVTGDIVGSGSTAYSTGLIVGKQGAEFQGVVTASSFKGSGADLTELTTSSISFDNLLIAEDQVSLSLTYSSDSIALLFL